MRHSIAGRQGARVISDYAQWRDGHVAYTFGNMDRKIVGRKRRVRSDALKNSDGISVKGPAGDRASQRTKHWLRKIDIDGETAGSFPSDGFIDQRKPENAGHVSIHDAPNQFDDCLQRGRELRPGICRGGFGGCSHLSRLGSDCCSKSDDS